MNSTQSSFTDKQRSIQLQFIKNLPQRFSNITSSWESLQEQKVQDCSSSDMYRYVHSLSGAAAVFGFPQLGKQAEKIETLLSQSKNYLHLPSFKEQIDKEISQLLDVYALLPSNLNSCIDENVKSTFSEIGRSKFRSKIEGLKKNYNGSEKQNIIYILDENNIVTKEVTEQLKQLGYLVKSFDDPNSLVAALNENVPNVVLLSADFSIENGKINTALNKISSTIKDYTSIIYVSEDDSWEKKLKAVRAGGDAFLQKPINIDELIEHMDMFEEKHTHSNYRILIVEDDLILAEHYAVILEAAGMQTKILNSPVELLNVLPEFIPDLVLMDIYMPECTGIEIASVIRQNLTYTNLPIVYLSTEERLKNQLEALQAGGDDFLTKPIGNEHLIAAVKTRAQRFSQMNALADKDGLTGLLNHINLKLALEREIIRTQRQGSHVCFSMLDLDHFKSVNDKYGHLIGDRVIKRLAQILNNYLRKTDVAARYGGEEFAIIFPDTELADAKLVLNKLREQFSGIIFKHSNESFSVTFSAGIVECSSYVNVTELIAAADSALYQAKEMGRNCVV